jgi:hypothetical protein
MWQNKLGKEGEQQQQQQHLVALQLGRGRCAQARSRGCSPPPSSHQRKHNTTYAKKQLFTENSQCGISAYNLLVLVVVILSTKKYTWRQQSKASSL